MVEEEVKEPEVKEPEAKKAKTEEAAEPAKEDVKMDEKDAKEDVKEDAKEDAKEDVKEDAKEEATEEKKEETKEPTGWEEHTLNLAEALDKDKEGLALRALCDASVEVIQGIGEVGAKTLSELKIETVKDLAEYKFFKFARALLSVVDMEKAGKRPEGSVMNVDRGVTVEWEKKTIAEILDAEITALQGIGEESGGKLKSLGIDTVRKLATWKFALWADAIVQLAEFEEDKTLPERKKEAAEKKLET